MRTGGTPISGNPQIGVHHCASKPWKRLFIPSAFKFLFPCILNSSFSWQSKLPDGANDFFEVLEISTTEDSQFSEQCSKQFLKTIPDPSRLS